MLLILQIDMILQFAFNALFVILKTKKGDGFHHHLLKKQSLFMSIIYTVLRLKPIKPIKAEPNNQPAAGNGT